MSACCKGVVGAVVHPGCASTRRLALAGRIVLSSPLTPKKWQSANQHSARNRRWMDSGRRLASLRLECFIVSFRGEFVGHGFLELFSIQSVAFGGVHENVVEACGGSLISRIQQADFEKQLAEFGIFIFA